MHDPSDTEPPIVEIVTPAFDAVLTSFADVIGTATDDNLLFYSLAYSTFEGMEYVEIVRGD